MSIWIAAVYGSNNQSQRTDVPMNRVAGRCAGVRSVTFDQLAYSRVIIPQLQGFGPRPASVQNDSMI